jgi:hypothetical protein
MPQISKNKSYIFFLDLHALSLLDTKIHHANMNYFKHSLMKFQKINYLRIIQVSITSKSKWQLMKSQSGKTVVFTRIKLAHIFALCVILACSRL